MQVQERVQMECDVLTIKNQKLNNLAIRTLNPPPSIHLPYPSPAVTAIYAIHPTHSLRLLNQLLAAFVLPPFYHKPPNKHVLLLHHAYSHRFTASPSTVVIVHDKAELVDIALLHPATTNYNYQPFDLTCLSSTNTIISLKTNQSESPQAHHKYSWLKVATIELLIQDVQGMTPQKDELYNWSDGERVLITSHNHKPEENLEIVQITCASPPSRIIPDSNIHLFLTELTAQNSQKPTQNALNNSINSLQQIYSFYIHQITNIHASLNSLIINLLSNSNIFTLLFFSSIHKSLTESTAFFTPPSELTTEDNESITDPYLLSKAYDTGTRKTASSKKALKSSMAATSSPKPKTVWDLSVRYRCGMGCAVDEALWRKNLIIAVKSDQPEAVIEMARLLELDEEIVPSLSFADDLESRVSKGIHELNSTGETVLLSQIKGDLDAFVLGSDDLESEEFKVKLEELRVEKFGEFVKVLRSGFDRIRYPSTLDSFLTLLLSNLKIMIKLAKSRYANLCLSSIQAQFDNLPSNPSVKSFNQTLFSNIEAEFQIWVSQEDLPWFIGTCLETPISDVNTGSSSFQTLCMILHILSPEEPKESIHVLTSKIISCWKRMHNIVSTPSPTSSNEQSPTVTLDSLFQSLTFENLQSGTEYYLADLSDALIDLVQPLSNTLQNELSIWKTRAQWALESGQTLGIYYRTENKITPQELSLIFAKVDTTLPLYVDTFSIHTPTFRVPEVKFIRDDSEVVGRYYAIKSYYAQKEMEISVSIGDVVDVLGYYGDGDKVIGKSGLGEGVVALDLLRRNDGMNSSQKTGLKKKDQGIVKLILDMVGEKKTMVNKSKELPSWLDVRQQQSIVAYLYHDNSHSKEKTLKSLTTQLKQQSTTPTPIPYLPSITSTNLNISSIIADLCKTQQDFNFSLGLLVDAASYMKNHAVSVDGLFGNSEKLLSIGIGLLFKFNGCDGVEGLFDVFLDSIDDWKMFLGFTETLPVAFSKLWQLRNSKNQLVKNVLGGLKREGILKRKDLEHLLLLPVDQIKCYLQTLGSLSLLLERKSASWQLCKSLTEFFQQIYNHADGYRKTAQLIYLQSSDSRKVVDHYLDEGSKHFTQGNLKESMQAWRSALFYSDSNNGIKDYILRANVISTAQAGHEFIDVSDMWLGLWNGVYKSISHSSSSLWNQVIIDSLKVLFNDDTKVKKGKEIELDPVSALWVLGITLNVSMSMSDKHDACTWFACVLSLISQLKELIGKIDTSESLDNDWINVFLEQLYTIEVKSLLSLAMVHEKGNHDTTGERVEMILLQAETVFSHLTNDILSCKPRQPDIVSLEATLLSHIGCFYTRKGKLIVSLNSHLKAFELYRILNQLDNQHKSLHNIAISLYRIATKLQTCDWACTFDVRLQDSIDSLKLCLDDEIVNSFTENSGDLPIKKLLESAFRYRSVNNTWKSGNRNNHTNIGKELMVKAHDLFSMVQEYFSEKGEKDIGLYDHIEGSPMLNLLSSKIDGSNGKLERMTSLVENMVRNNQTAKSLEILVQIIKMNPNKTTVLTLFSIIVIRMAAYKEVLTCACKNNIDVLLEYFGLELSFTDDKFISLKSGQDFLIILKGLNNPDLDIRLLSFCLKELISREFLDLLGGQSGSEGSIDQKLLNMWITNASDISICPSCESKVMASLSELLSGINDSPFNFPNIPTCYHLVADDGKDSALKRFVESVDLKINISERAKETSMKGEDSESHDLDTIKENIRLEILHLQNQLSKLDFDVREEDVESDAAKVQALPAYES